MLEEFFSSEREAINNELELFFENINKKETEVLFTDFYNQLKEFITPKKSKAKRIHPILLIAAFNGIINPIYLEDQIDEIRKASIAMEFLHSGHLIHDDLIDNDDTRRGNPTFHVQLRNEIDIIYKSMNIFSEEKRKERRELYGRDLSILGGCFGYLLGLEIIRSTKFPEPLKLLSINEYAEAVDFLIKGQIIFTTHESSLMTLELFRQDEIWFVEKGEDGE